MDKRPTLSKDIEVFDFKRFYWDKKDLTAFCRKNKIPADGNKIDLADRIERYLSSGEKINRTSNKSKKNYDSDNIITVETKVVNYKNDSKTREFFVSQVGSKFKFNYYLRSFANQENDGNITYGDLVEGYKESLLNKKTTIDKQFEYNQFQRDFYRNNFNKTRGECNEAWKLIKAAPGGSTYKDYLRLIMERKTTYL